MSVVNCSIYGVRHERSKLIYYITYDMALRAPQPPVMNPRNIDIQEIRNGIIDHMVDHVAERAIDRALSDIDAKTQELHAQMVSAYRDLTLELKDTIHSYKKKMTKMMDAKIQELNEIQPTVVVMVEHRDTRPIQQHAVVDLLVAFAAFSALVYVLSM